MWKTMVRSPLRNLAQELPFGFIELAKFRAEAASHRFGIERVISHDPSVVLFTTHKVASTFTDEMLKYLNTNVLGLSRMDWDRYIHNKYPQDTTSWLSGHVEELFRPRGYAYGPFRAVLPIEQLESYRILLILRDPRDVLTSGYFSEAFSHVEPFRKERKATFEKRRSDVQGMTVDEYALARASSLASILDQYLEMCQATGAVPVRYEDMILAWDTFMADIERSLGTEIDLTHRSKLYELGRVGEDRSENIHEHVRKGLPGDHREKLSDDTIATLNETFERHLEWLSIDKDGSVRER